ncbi:MAG: type IV pilin protein [Granulosicoccus sp.]
MKRTNHGFTLVEILIAGAVLGVLASIALPMYSTYVKKAKLSEAVQFSQEINLSMTQLYLNKRTFPSNGGSFDYRNSQIGYGGPSQYKNDVIDGMWVGSGGVNGAAATSGHIVVRIKPELKAGINGSTNASLISTVEFINGSFEFICGNTTGHWPSTVDPAYLPKSCQN